MGVCTPKMFLNYFEENGHATNLYEYEQFIFDNVPEMREEFFKEWPADAARPDSFDGWAKAASQGFDVYAW